MRLHLYLLRPFTVQDPMAGEQQAAMERPKLEVHEREAAETRVCHLDQSCALLPARGKHTMLITRHQDLDHRLSDLWMPTSLHLRML